jgi:hypothetical protein
MLIGSVIWLLRRGTREWPYPALSETGIIGALVFWTATALARAQFQQPDASRYVYPSAVFILLTAIGFMRWRRIDLRIAGGAVVAGAVIAIVGYWPLHTYAFDRDSVDARVRVAFGAAQIDGPAGNPASFPDYHHLSYITLGTYMRAVHELGSPAYTPAQIQQQQPAYRLLADQVVIHTEGLSVEPAGPRPRAGSACSRLRAGFGTVLELSVRSGVTVHLAAARGVPLQVRLRRFSAQFPPAPQWVVRAGTAARLGLPRDDSTLPWHVQVTAHHRSLVGPGFVLVTACVAPLAA